ncbi:MAG: DUF4491 family protein [Anaerolineae bacterium]
MNWIGLTAALTAFLSIWFGHVAVRKIEFLSPTTWLPTLLFALLGVLTEYGAFFTSNRALSIAGGILGITFLWDALEILRQEKRVHKGHAPANPHNPRHARFLAEPASLATTRDLLKRPPQETPEI